MKELADSIKLIRKTLLPESAALAAVNQLVELVAEMNKYHESFSYISGKCVMLYSMGLDSRQAREVTKIKDRCDLTQTAIHKADALLTGLEEKSE